eukprot:scaffold1252_cov124-Isochrysis_galbana.AAC.12
MSCSCNTAGRTAFSCCRNTFCCCCATGRRTFSCCRRTFCCCSAPGLYSSAQTTSEPRSGTSRVKASSPAAVCSVGRRGEKTTWCACDPSCRAAFTRGKRTRISHLPIGVSTSTPFGGSCTSAACRPREPSGSRSMATTEPEP